MNAHTRKVPRTSATFLPARPVLVVNDTVGNSGAVDRREEGERRPRAKCFLLQPHRRRSRIRPLRETGRAVVGPLDGSVSAANKGCRPGSRDGCSRTARKRDVIEPRSRTSPKERSGRELEGRGQSDGGPRGDRCAAAAAVHRGRGAGRRRTSRATRRCSRERPGAVAAPTAGLHFDAERSPALARAASSSRRSRCTSAPERSSRCAVDDISAAPHAPRVFEHSARRRPRRSRARAPAAAGSSRSARPSCARSKRPPAARPASARAGAGETRPLHHAGLRLPRRRPAGHELPPAEEHAADAGRAFAGLERDPRAYARRDRASATASSATATRCSSSDESACARSMSGEASAHAHEDHRASNGPYIIEGECELVDSTGMKVDLAGKTIFALCRCGGSMTKPFCNGQHQQARVQGCGSRSRRIP